MLLRPGLASRTGDSPVHSKLLSSYCSCGPGWCDQWLAAHRHFAKHGCDIFWLMPTGGYNGEWATTPKGGRIACVLATPFGEATKGDTAFWDSPGWIKLMENTVRWLTKKEE